jgi:hypothetical protein
MLSDQWRVAGVGTEEDPLEEWLDTLLERFLGLSHDEAVEGIDLDFSAGSLRGLEAVVVARFDFADDVRGPDDEDFVLSVAGYLGEALLRLAGGSWSWDDDPDSASYDLALVEADPALGLDSVSPVELIVTAAQSRGGEQFAGLYSTWDAVVRGKVSEEPSWRPTKEPTDVDLLEPDHARHLRTWLAGMRAGFADWAASSAPGAVLDFSPESLSALEEMARTVASTREDLSSPANREFFNEASWYVGEVFRRGLGGRWTYDGPAYPDNPSEYLRQVGPYDGKIVPALTLGNAIEESGHLRAHYDAFAA